MTENNNFLIIAEMLSFGRTKFSSAIRVFVYYACNMHSADRFFASES